MRSDCYDSSGNLRTVVIITPQEDEMMIESGED
jgi:hypothetical protein